MSDNGRPAVSGSMALYCRQKIWLAAHGYPKETPLAGAQRTFGMGHIIEHAMFREVRLSYVSHDGKTEDQIIGPWFDPNNPGYVGEVRDHATGQSFVADMSQLSSFQREVSFAGFKGHMDALLTLDTGIWVPDVKSTQGYGFDRALTSNLYEDPFGRQYVGQVLAYASALRDEGLDVKGGILIYFNKENSQVCCRFLPYDQAIVDEAKERLSWATNDAEPEPDWKWVRGEKIPLLCSYCDFKQACSGVRGQGLVQGFDKKNKPIWVAA